MSIKLEKPITIYQIVYAVDSEIFNVNAVQIKTLGDALDLGRTALWTKEEGYVNLFPTRKAAIEEAFRRNCQIEAGSSHSTDCCQAGCSESCCCTDASTPESPVDDYLPLDEFPSKLVRFTEDEVIRLYRRKPGQKQSANCVFISKDVVEMFKHDCSCKSNYSLIRAQSPELYKVYENTFFASGLRKEG